MMPSRGLRPVQGFLSHAARAQQRNLSSGPLKFRGSLHRAPLHRLRSPQTLSPRSITLPTLTIGGLRYASTTSVTPSADSTSTIAHDAAFPNLDTITLDNVNAAVSDGALVSPEQIGYLHSIGVDYGWGPTTMIQWMLEHVHVYSGLPWWGSIMVTALGFRLAMFPLFVKAADAGARSMAIVPVTNPLMEQMKIAQKSGKSAEAAMYMQKVMAIRKEAGASVFAPFVPLVLQGIFGYCGFKLMHHLATLPVPEFHDGGFGWIQDLTLTDGYLIIPAFMSVILHLTVRLGGESGNRQVLPPAMMNIMLWGMPGIMFFFLAWQPAAVALWFLTTGGVSITQGQLLQRPAVREALGIAPIIKLEGSSNLIADFFATAEKKDEKKKNTFKIEDLNDLNESLTKGDFSYQAPTLKTRAPSPDKVIDAKLVPKRGPSKS